MFRFVVHYAYFLARVMFTRLYMFEY